MSFANNTCPIIFGCSGPVLDAEERAFFSAAKPAGFILFQKNCVDAAQVARLCAELRDCVGWHAPVLIDQEGGRVQRLRTPGWPGNFPAMRAFGDLYARQPQAALAAVAQDHAALAAAQCPMGVDVNCVPVLDVVPAQNTVRAIDDRSFGHDVQAVTALGLAAVNASLAAGMTPVMKHIPGHGRATVDSHHALPHIDADLPMLEGSDFAPFRHVAASVDNAALWGMSAHVIYRAIDPELPATLSPTVIGGVIRQGLKFDGLLLTDDLFMDALAPYGDVPERARRAVEAGIDIALHCHGDVAARERAVESTGPMRPETARRMANWLAVRPVYTPLEAAETLLARVQGVLAS